MKWKNYHFKVTEHIQTNERTKTTAPWFNFPVSSLVTNKKPYIYMSLMRKRHISVHRYNFGPTETITVNLKIGPFNVAELKNVIKNLKKGK